MNIILDYVITVIFFVILGFFYFLFGTSLMKDDLKLESTKVIFGFICHTLPLAIIGIIVQLLKLQWKLFFIYAIFWTIWCICFSIYIVKKRKLKLFEKGIAEFIREYWFFLILIAIFMVALSCNAGRMWADNLTDDGYYLVRIANLPYMSNCFSYEVTTGFKSNGITSYVLNTWELEFSVYLYILQVLPSIFVRFGMAIFNYFLILCGLHSLIGKINEKFYFNHPKKILQYYCFILIPVLCGMNTLSNSFLSLALEDTWKNTSAMYYGSTLVRLLLPLNMLEFFCSIEKINIKEILKLSVLSIVFVSRSTVAIPFIFLCVVSYLVVYLIKSRKYYLMILMIIFIFFISLLTGNNQVVEKATFERVVNNITSIVTLFLVFMFILSFFSCRKKEYLFLLALLIFAYLFACIEPVNNIYESICNYDFVTGRVLYSLYFLMYIILIVFVIFIIYKKQNKLKKLVCICTMLLCTFSIIYTQNIYGDGVEANNSQIGGTGIKKSLLTLKNNKTLTPDSTVDVGKKLHELELKENKRLKVVSTFDWLSIDGYAHYPSLTYRAYAPNIYNYTAYFRIGDDNKNYTWNEHVSMCNFSGNPSPETYKYVKNILKRLKFDCIVSNNVNIQDYISKEYYLYTTVLDNNGINSFYLFTRK